MTSRNEKRFRVVRVLRGSMPAPTSCLSAPGTCATPTTYEESKWRAKLNRRNSFAGKDLRRWQRMRNTGPKHARRCALRSTRLANRAESCRKENTQVAKSVAFCCIVLHRSSARCSKLVAYGCRHLVQKPPGGGNSYYNPTAVLLPPYCGPTGVLLESCLQESVKKPENGRKTRWSRR